MEKYKQAGKICADTKNEVLKMIKPGVKILEVAELVDNFIRNSGAKTAFPVNISINEIAAHYTPTVKDETVVSEGDLVKVDIGVHVDGYIGDMAFTYCSKQNPLVECVQKCLDSAIALAKPGTKVSEIGETVETTAKTAGLGVIVNLTGHGLSQYNFHAPPSIPNVKNNSSHVLEDGEVIAIEPFVCKGNGFVKEGGTAEIYRYITDRPVRLTEARKMLELIKENYQSFPFAKRWLSKEFSPIKTALALRQLESAGALENYPPLREMEGRPIAQAEDTVIVSEKPIITTRG